ncbi:TIGR00153 family protein [Methanococcoides alaskense]|uniref:Phosphate transport protein (TIGR00153 family) n=1 Tax=Methanococcoides alaskense TaxID=325778 RepID=A0AA90Z7G3_9EURY|nr:TIGR00153 family protein [Methanococcoides alaskense]MDA0524005.1 TIGR00153 family protein [Methanococcoides alaskense]MDR6222454.1 putative phosphate transport protein (TIGR00153 family) [Methanococcoides alaskense]
MKREYIRSVLSVFAKSPFKPLYLHASKGVETVRKLDQAVNAYCTNMPLVEELSHEIDNIEHEADIIKQTIRGQLSSSIMLPVNAEDLLNFLKPQDSIADVAQEAAYMLTLRQCDMPEGIKDQLCQLSAETVKTVEIYEKLVDSLSELLETSFSKREVEETLALVPQIEEMEHITDLIEKDLVKDIYAHEKELGAVGVFYFIELVRTIADIADKTEHAADRLRTMIIRR